MKSAQTQIVGGNDTSAEAVVRAISALDKAANKGIIHKNQAARRKARLMASAEQSDSLENYKHEPSRISVTAHVCV